MEGILVSLYGSGKFLGKLWSSSGPYVLFSCDCCWFNHFKMRDFTIMN